MNICRIASAVLVGSSRLFHREKMLMRSVSFLLSPRCIALAILVGSSGLEPPTSRLSGARSNQLSYEPIDYSVVFPTGTLPALPTGGDDGIRTHDPLLAGQVLSQLSYTPMDLHPFGSRIRFTQGCGVGHDLPSHAVASIVLSALQSLTSVFGMGTGGPSALI